jgi:hypothetical protein
MDRKYSSRTYIIVSTSVCTRVAGHAGEYGFPVAVDIGAALGVDDVD